jgi:Tfp pilus assembly protein PilO
MGIVDIIIVLPMARNITEVNREQIKQAEEVGLASKILLKEEQVNRSQLLSLDKVDDLFDRLTELGKKSRLEIKVDSNLGIDKIKTKDKKYIRRIIRLEASGSFKDLGLFLSAVHQEPETILEVNMMNLSRNAKNPAVVQANINYVLYALKDEENQS